MAPDKGAAATATAVSSDVLFSNAFASPFSYSLVTDFPFRTVAAISESSLASIRRQDEPQHGSTSTPGTTDQALTARRFAHGRGQHNGSRDEQGNQSFRHFGFSLVTGVKDYLTTQSLPGSRGSLRPAGVGPHPAACTGLFFLLWCDKHVASAAAGLPRLQVGNFFFGVAQFCFQPGSLHKAISILGLELVDTLVLRV